MPHLLKILSGRLRDALERAFPEGMRLLPPTSRAPADPAVKPTQDPRFGDYQANGAMGLAKALGRQPREVAEAWRRAARLDDLAESVEVAGPGFLNIRLRGSFLEHAVAAVWADPRLGVEAVARPKTIVFDYSSPNVAKPLHVGHLRSTIIGDALVRILRFVGHRVITDNHLGDWGTMFGLLIVGYERGLADEAAMREDPLAEVGRVYKAMAAAAEHDPGLQQAAREAVVRLQAGDPHARALWQRLTAASQDELEELYGKLGVQFDHTLPESFYQPMLAEVVDSLLKAGVATISDGAVCIFDPAAPEAPPLIVRKSDGAFLYATTDLAAVKYRCETWRPDQIIYETDDGQCLHFAQLFQAARRWGYDRVELTHVCHGKVLGADGRRLKTRAGQTPSLHELLEAAVARARQVVDAQNPDLPEAQRHQVAEVVGIGAVKYADLSVSRTSDYRFDLDRMLAMDGNTAPYMQYAYARIRSIFRKGGIDPTAELAGLETVSLADPSERALALAALRFPEAIDEVLVDYRPNLLTQYLYDLAQKFSVFYEACPVLKADGETVRRSRLALCDLTARIIQRGLDLLGIRTIEQM